MIPTLQVGDVFLIRPSELSAPSAARRRDRRVRRTGSGAKRRVHQAVIGVPGDTIRISGGIVYRNGRPLSEPYENQPPNYDLEVRNYTIYVDGSALDPAQADIPPRGMWQAPDRVPRGFYFMLGDNRNYSDDSHVWGFAKQASFSGRAFMILWPHVKEL